MGAICGAVLAAVAPAAESATRLPALLTGLSAKQFAVRPAEVSYTGDGAGQLGGFDGSGRYPHYGHLRWSSWTSRTARASGAVWIDNCVPDCASGKLSPFAVTVRLSAPTGGHFTVMVLRYRYHGRATVDRRHVVKSGSNYFWG